ncbi:MAG: DNA/RNA nuclease SfsA [Planctomycetes bacterium]|nr:DNA/RNA nuclease SfsA [Planctomycetota bacterium]
MRFDRPLAIGALLRRYKRFMADIRLDDGSEIVAHIANTGSMAGCATVGSKVALSHHPDSGRKLPWSWELVDVGGFWVCVNTALPNRIVEEAIRSGRIGPLRGYKELAREVPYGARSRIDIKLLGKGRPCFVEVKNVTLRVGRRAAFPDSVTERGRRHLEELSQQVREGARAVMLFLVNRADCSALSSADHIDPAYGATLRRVQGEGVELLAYRTRPTLGGITIEKKLPVRLD